MTIAELSDALREAHKALKKAVPKLRRDAHQTEGKLASAFRQALTLIDSQREAGVSREERLQGLDAVLRDAWPTVRPWKYVCQRCDDVGWAPAICTPDRPCGRPFRLSGSAGDDYTGRGRCTPGHDYVEPCLCSKGQDFRRQLLKQRRPEDFAQAAARTKPTKVGR